VNEPNNRGKEVHRFGKKNPIVGTVNPNVAYSTGKNRCARVIVPHLRACSEKDLTYGQVLLILSQTARVRIWRTLARFSSTWVCSIRVQGGATRKKKKDPREDDCSKNLATV
jgi:hypothetical protein